ncbi:MAG: hypothetical protein JWQ76_7 [Ramlibacter sp.]|nr:hypothetical protein [Ramlibacter sp.]
MPFNVTQRQVIVFTAGITLGVAAAWAVFGWHSGGGEPVAHATVPAPVAKAGKAAPTAVAVAVGACAFTPVVATAAGDDGRVQIQPELSGRSGKDVDAWILDGKEAVAAGRQRDAESDFLMACRAAEKLGDSGAMPQAEAMYHLGRHYAGLAGAASEPRSGELWRRAEGLFAASLQAYSARYGESSDKTRFATKGLVEAREHTGGGPTVAAAAVPSRPAVAKPAKAALAKAEPPKELAPAPAPAAAVKEPVVKPAAPRQPEPAVAAAAPAPLKIPEAKVAVVMPWPRPAVQDAEESAVMEPPARAVGNAIGSATGDAHDSGAAAQ